MPSRKRARSEIDSEEATTAAPNIPSMLTEIRGMWEFAALMQYLFFFGRAVKLEDIDVEDFEDECLKPGHSEKLSQMGLALLKQVSSHKGLTPDIFDEYTRRQFTAKAPTRNPFGTDEEALKFAEFDVFTKIRILHQLSVWTLNNPNPIREKLNETDSEQTNWRVEPFGWDKEERIYYLLDDNRLYRRTDAPPPPEEAPKPKPKAKKAGRATRSNKRRRISRTIPETSPEDEGEEATEVKANGVDGDQEGERMDAFCMTDWELIATSMDEYNDFMDSIRKSRDPNEKALIKAIKEMVFPVLQEQEEERKRKEERRLRELETLQKLATAKRSSRLAGKQEKMKEQHAIEEAERKRIAELEMAHKEQEKLQHMEHARESRRETREQRLREREMKRVLEEERLQQEQELLKKLEAEGKTVDEERARISERKLKADMEKRKKELESLQQEDNDWYFDCSVCGVHGQNWDDGSHNMACDKCNVWQHSACHGISQQQAEREDFRFLCNDCKKKMEQPVTLKLRGLQSPNTLAGASRDRPAGSPLQNGPSLSPLGQSSGPPGGFTQPRPTSSSGLVYPGPPRPPPSASASAYPNGSLQRQPMPAGLPATANGHTQNGFGQSRPPPNGYPTTTGAIDRSKPPYTGNHHPQPHYSPPQRVNAPKTGYSPPAQQQPAAASSPPTSNGYIYQHYGSQPTAPPTVNGNFVPYSPPKQRPSAYSPPNPRPVEPTNPQPVAHSPPQPFHPASTVSRSTVPAPSMPGTYSSIPASSAYLPPMYPAVSTPGPAAPSITSPQQNVYGSSPGFSPVKRPQPPMQASPQPTAPMASVVEQKAPEAPKAPIIQHAQPAQPAPFGQQVPQPAPSAPTAPTPPSA